MNYANYAYYDYVEGAFRSLRTLIKNIKDTYCYRNYRNMRNWQPLSFFNSHYPSRDYHNTLTQYAEYIFLGGVPKCNWRLYRSIQKLI
jgi:hypothetical protein